MEHWDGWCLCWNPLEEHCNFNLTRSCSPLSSGVQQQLWQIKTRNINSKECYYFNAVFKNTNRYKKFEKLQLQLCTTTKSTNKYPKNGNRELRAPGGKIWTLCPGGKDGSHILFSPRSSGLIKMKANCAIKGKHVFMVMELESAVSPSLHINPDSSSLLNMVKPNIIITFWLMITLHNCKA